MKSLFFLSLILFTNLCFGQVGVGTTTPDASSILDVNSTTKGFLPPRVTKAQRDAITSPAKGLVVYCTNCSSTGGGCLTTNNGTPSAPSWECVGATTSSISAVCNGFVSGTYIAGVSVNGSYTVTITNNSFSGATISFQSSDLVLSGVSGSPALTVGTPTGSPALSSGTATLLSGASVTVTYPITGTPTTTGTLTGTWTKISLNCSATKAVTSLSGSLATTYCTNATVNGAFVSAVALNSTNTFKVTLTNTSGSAISSLPAPATSNLALSYSGTTSTAFTASSVTPAATFNLAAGASQEFVYTISGTPSSTGTLTLNWTYSDLTCTKTKDIGLGDAVFTKAKNNAYIFSVNDVSITPNVVSQGTLAIGTTIQVPYTSGSGSYLAFASSFVSIPSQYCEDGGSDWTFGYSYSAGTFASSGNITVTLITKKAGVNTAWTAKRVASAQTINFDCVTLPWSVNGNTYSNTVGLDEGGDAIRGSLALSGCASCTAYDNTTADSWVQITATEYNGLASGTVVQSVSKMGAPDARMTSATIGNGWGSGAIYTVGNGSDHTQSPANSYIIAYSFRTSNSPASTGTVVGHKVKYSSSATSGYAMYGNALPNFTGTASTRYYFVIKRPSTLMASVTYLAATNETSTTLGAVDWDYYSSYPPAIVFSLGDGTALTTSNNYSHSIQAISSTIKQW